MIMWYDVLVLGILGFFALRGAMRGFIFQVASLAGIVLAFIFADAVSNAAGPYVHLDPPLNHWVLMVASYLGFTLLCFLAARMLNEAIEKCKLKEFDRHLGVAFGLVKGVLLVLIMTFFVVTVSESARASLRNSYTGRYCAIIMDRLEPILPHKMHVALEDYIHLLDSPDLPLIHSHDPFERPAGSDFDLGLPSTIPGYNNPANSSGAPASGSSSLWSQLQSVFDSQTKQVVDKALQGTDAQTRAQIEQKLNTIISSIPPQERANLQQQIVNAGTGQLQQFLDWKLSQLTQPVNSTVPAGSNIPAPIPSTTSSTPGATASQQLEVIREIAAIYSNQPSYKQNIENDIQRRISGVPANVSNAALYDWRADLLGVKPDPDPATTAEMTVEVRILNQLRLQGVRIEQLSAEAQQRLRATQAQLQGSGNSL